MGRKASESMPKAEPITEREEIPLPQENLVEYVKLKGINMIAVHASNNGTAEKYASALCDEAESHQYNCISVDADEIFADDLPRLSEFDNIFIVFLVATYEGKPSLNARKMYDWLSQDANIVPSLKYAVFGLGDTSYGAEFNSTAKTFDARLEALGGKRLLLPGMGDRNPKESNTRINDDFKDWRNKLWIAADEHICAISCSQCNSECCSCGDECKKRSLIDRIKESKATILVIYGSNSEKAKSFSHDLKDSALKNGFNSLVISVAELNLDDIPKLSGVKNLVVLLCMSTNSDGKSSCNADKFFDWIQEGKSGLNGLRYAIFGLGSTKHENVNILSKTLDEKMGILGGDCIYELGFGNEDKDDSGEESSLADDFQKWNDGLWTAIKQSCV